MASTTSPPMMDGSTSGSATTPPRLRWRAYGGGGTCSALPAIRPPKRLLINADCGGSNGNRVRLWKRELQVLADELGIAITVNHLPPGDQQMEPHRAQAVRLHVRRLAHH